MVNIAFALKKYIVKLKPIFELKSLCWKVNKND
jgi:hypothetical protein